MLISHEFYLADSIASIANTTPSTIWSSVEATSTAIEESGALTPATRQEFREQLKDAVTLRICVFLEKMNYIDMRQYVARLIGWVINNRTHDRHLFQLIAALEKHAQPIDRTTEHGYETNPLDEESFLPYYPDDVAWRMLIDYENEFTFPYIVFDNEDEDEEDDNSGHFRWRKFVTDHKWVPGVQIESRIFGTVNFNRLLANKETTFTDLTFPLHEQSVLIYTLDPDSCANLIIHPTGNGGVGDATIIPRVGIALHINIDRASVPSLLDDGLRVENAALGLYAVDVADEFVYDRPMYERSATVELMDDGTVRILTPPSKWPFWK